MTQCVIAIASAGELTEHVQCPPANMSPQPSNGEGEEEGEGGGWDEGVDFPPNLTSIIIYSHTCNQVTHLLMQLSYIIVLYLIPYCVSSSCTAGSNYHTLEVGVSSTREGGGTVVDII